MRSYFAVIMAIMLMLVPVRINPAESTIKINNYKYIILKSSGAWHNHEIIAEFYNKRISEDPFIVSIKYTDRKIRIGNLTIELQKTHPLDSKFQYMILIHDVNSGKAIIRFRRNVLTGEFENFQISDPLGILIRPRPELRIFNSFDYDEIRMAINPLEGTSVVQPMFSPWGCLLDVLIAGTVGAGCIDACTTGGLTACVACWGGWAAIERDIIERCNCCFI